MWENFLFEKKLYQIIEERFFGATLHKYNLINNPQGTIANNQY